MKRMFYFLAVAAALLLVAPPAVAAPSLINLPARFRGGDVFLLAGIAGGKPLWMKLDIAGAQSSLSPRIAATLGLRAPTATLRIGTVGFSAVAFRAEENRTCTDPDGNPLAGVLGADALGDRPLWIDTRHKQVWISELPPDAPAGLQKTADAR